MWILAVKIAASTNTEKWICAKCGTADYLYVNKGSSIIEDTPVSCVN